MYPFQDLKEAIKNPSDVNEVSVVAFGGIPECEDKHWDPQEVGVYIHNAIGQGSLITFMNPKDRNRDYFAEKAIEDKHFWALRTLYITVLFSDIPQSFRESLAFSRRFHISWQEKEYDTVMVTAQGSLRDWRKFLDHRFDGAFKLEHRHIMVHTHTVLREAGVPESVL